MVSNADHDTVSILLGGGDGTFAQPAPSYPAGSGPSSVAAADLDDDGDPDLVVTAAGSDQVALLFGHGDGIFSAAVFLPVASTAV